MELALEPELYTPSVNDDGNYIDNVLNFNVKSGIVCCCGTRKDKIYNTKSKFISHTKTKTHQQWLKKLNNDKQNYFQKNQNLNKLVNNQKLIISNLQKQLDIKNNLIISLSEKIYDDNIKYPKIDNLIDL